MQPKESTFNRRLLVILVILYLLSIAVFSYLNWAGDPQFMQWWKTLLNIPILSIPLILLYGSIYVLVVAWRQHAAGQVSPRLAKVIRWAPRGAAILIIFFTSLFSLDVFDSQASPLELLGGLLMHNIPSLVMLALLIVAWKRPAVGFFAFLIVAGLFIIFFVRSIYALSNLLLFVLPLLMVAGLFYIDWKWIGPEG